jgi:asparagine synthase (glutamine-hydrolysing)
MGGIGGIHCLAPGVDPESREMDSMVKQISHRGNLTKIFRWEGGGLFSNYYEKSDCHCEADQVCVVVDGEVFWHDESADDGRRPYKNDGEMILDLYLRHGEDFAKRIDGSYGIAIHDGNRKKLILLRERLGYKPLFYFVTRDFIIFGSEIKAILGSGLCKKTIDLRALNNFLSYGYVSSPDSLFESIRQVKPGHMIICEEGKVTDRLYWKFNYPVMESQHDERYYKETFLKLLEKAVSKRLAKHADCGAFLSGGLDTSAVVAMMSKLRGNSFKVFSGGFKEEKYNEIDDAKIVANHFNVDQQVVCVEFDKNFPSLLEKIVWYHDSPFADTSAIPSYYAAKLAKEHVDTVLTGDFPDQLIGGSGHHVMALRRLREDHFFYHLLRNKGLNKAVRRLNWSAGGTSVLDKAKRAIYRETFPLDEQRILLSMPIPPLLKRCLYSPELLEINEKYDPLNAARSIYSEVKEEDLLNRLLYFDVLSYAPDDLMVKVERMTMAHGLNAISPFHDLELVEFIASVPSHLKINGTTRKYIMREALRPLLPEHTLNKRKQGFAMPIGEWLVAKMSDYVQDILLDSRTLNRGYFNKKYMERMVRNFLAGKTDYATGSEAAIIALITLELWHRIFIDN